MDDDKRRFLFGDADVDLDGCDLADEDERLELFEEHLPPAFDRVADAVRTAVATQILDDDPPETWATARRLLDEGLDREQVLRQLTMVMLAHLHRAMAERARFDRDQYLADLLRLPLPSAEATTDAFVETTRARQGIEVAELDARVAERLGHGGPLDDDTLLRSLLDRVFDHLVDDGDLALLAGDRVVHPPSLLPGVTLTHRLSDFEVELGVLTVVSDLAPFRRLDAPTVEGEPVEVFSVDRGHLGWGVGDWLGERFASDDLVAVRTDTDDAVQVEVVAAEPELDDGLVARLREAYDAEVAEPWLPVDIEDLVFALVVDDPTAFSHPSTPLRELCEAAGLEVRQRWVAHDPTVWHAERRLQRLHRAMDVFEDDERRRRTALHVLDVVDVAGGVDPSAVPDLHGAVDRATLRRALRDLDDVDVLAFVTDELFGHPFVPDHLDLDDPDAEAVFGGHRGEPEWLVAGRFTEAAIAAAERPVEVAVAHLLAALLAEQRQRPVDAEAHLATAHDADPGFVPTTERLAWYASDRGDARRAVQLWDQAVESAVIMKDLEVVRAAARSSGAAAAEPGRNDPCWCGSGRKYKQCHLGVPRRLPLPDRVGWLCRKAAGYLERSGGEAADDVITLAIARAGSEDPADVADMLDDEVVIDLVLTEGGWFRRFLHDRGPLLPEDEAMLASSWLLVERSVHEVLEVRRGEGLTLQDLRTGETTEVRERTLSRDASVGELFCARAVPDGESHQLVGAVLRVRPGTEETWLALVDEGDPYELAAWIGAEEAPPLLTNAEGEDLVLCDLVLEVPDAVAATTALDRLFDREDDLGDGLGEWDDELEADLEEWDDDVARWVEHHRLPDGEWTVRATIGQIGTRVSITTTSEERADRTLGTVLAAIDGARLVRETRRPIDEIVDDELDERGADRGDETTLADEVAPPLDPATVVQLQERMEQRWCDEAVPALGGLTPRAAAADPTRREQLERLLTDFERRPTPPGAFTMRPDRLRALLGIDHP